MTRPKLPVAAGVANHGTMKSHNIATFMQTLRHHAPVSRADLSRLTGLDKKCVSLFSSELIEKGLIEEVGTLAAARGRPGCLLDFVPGRNFSIGLAIQADRVNGVLFELPGRLAAAAVHPIAAGAARREVAETVKRAAGDLAARTERVAGVGVSFPGIVDLRDGVVLTAANLSCLDNFRFRESFQDLESLYGPVRFEQSSRAAALAENWFGQGRSSDNFASVELNVGISVVMVQREELHHGPEGFVGELGHVIVQPLGRKCGCGNRGCLEAYLGESALKAGLTAMGLTEDALFLPNSLPRLTGSAQDPGEAAPLPPAVVKLLRDAGQWLGRGLGPIVNLFTPDSVVINGEIMRHADIVLPSARKELTKCCLPEKLRRTTLVASRLHYPDAMGTAALAFAEWF